MNKERYLASVKKGKVRAGRKDLIDFLEGKRLTQNQAIRAKCYDCMGFYDDEARDCQGTTCPLYPFMPFNPNRQSAVAKSTGEKAVAA